MKSTTYSIDDLSRLTGITVRTIRFYIQSELVSRPEGSTRASHYLDKHLEELLRIKRLTAEGRSLESIRTLLRQDAGQSQAEATPGSVRVCSHIHIAQGVELVIDPTSSGLTLDEIRAVARSVLEALPAGNDR